MRTFISIDIPESVKEQIVRIQEQLPEFKGKFTETENLHLTLKFLGEISQEKIEDIKKKLREINFSRFEAKIDAIGVFSQKFVKIVWLHLTNCEELQKKIDENLFELGFEKEKRFMSHLTIARVKSLKNKKEFLESLKEIRISKINFIVNNFKLKESVLKEKGPQYNIIQEYFLD